jgi:hypothetical protein
MVTGLHPRTPIHYMSWVGIVMAVCAGALALYGGMHAEKHLAGSPLRAARGSAGLLPPPPSDYQPLKEYVNRRVNEEAEKSTGNWKRGEKTWNTVGAAVTWVYRYGRGATDRYILARTEESKIANYSLQLFAFVLPFFLGLAGALTGGWAMKVVQASGGKYAGNTLAVFSMMIGGLAAVVAGCMMISLYVWPRLPSMYTT